LVGDGCVMHSAYQRKKEDVSQCVGRKRHRWIVAGWYKPGMISDEGTADAPLFKLTEKIHISSIWPVEFEGLEDKLAALHAQAETPADIPWEVDEDPVFPEGENCASAADKDKRNTGGSQRNIDERQKCATKKALVIGGGTTRSSANAKKTAAAGKKRRILSNDEGRVQARARGTAGERADERNGEEVSTSDTAFNLPQNDDLVMTEDTCDRQQRCMSCLREGYWASPLELILVSTQGLRAKKYGALRRTDIQLRRRVRDAAGNLPHLHLLAKLDDSVTDAEARARIECAESRIHDIGGGLTVSAEDSERLVEEGLIERVNDWMTYYTDFEKIQSHSCERADFRCHKRRKVVVDEENNEERIVSECRVPHYRPAYNDSFDVMNAPHSAEALQLLLRLGLGRRLAGTGEIVVGEELIAGRHQYSSDLGTHISPTIPRLFLSTRSSSNTQVCDKYFNSRYLSKYLCGAEERASADLRVTCDGSLRVDVDRIRNRKLGVDHMRESRLGRKRYREEYRLVASPESCWWVYDLPYILSDEEFLTCPTRPLSQRSGRLRNGRPGGSSDNVDGVDHRHTIEGLTDDRKYTENQRLIYRSVMLSECTVDNLVAFELRPPELRFVDNPIRFLENFTWRKSHNGQQGISEDLKASPWTDCLNRQWRVRKSAVKGIQLCAIESDDSLGYDVYRSILEHLDSVEVERELYERFVDDSASGSKRCIVVTSLPRPSNVLGFLVHILLSRGRFTTELDLYAAGSMTEAFRIAGLIPRDRNVEPEDVDALLQAYVVDELVFNPVGGTKGFDNCLVVADKVLRGLLLEGCIAYEELPIAEEEELIIDGMADAREVHEAGRERIIQCMTGELGDAVPTAEQLRGATLSNPLTWKPKLRATAEQTAASRVEQQEILDNIIERCNCWLRGGHTPLILIEGMPGCGKSHLAKFLAVYMLSRGMSLIMTALASERAMSLGGCHIHHEFGLPVSNEWDQSTSEQHAFNAYRKLASRPAQLHRLQRAHALIIDEIFTLNAKTYHTIDILLRRIRGNAAPCGGLLLVATGDYRQLPPVSGRLSCRLHWRS
ncbi:hypothetical protein FOZ61_010750, partial [Perkinsus olseni]